MNSFKRALIQAILEEYGDTYSTDKQTCNLKFQKMNGSTDIVEDNSEYSSNAEISAVSLWINIDSKDIYPTPCSGTNQYVFKNKASRSTCMNLLLKHGFSIHNP